MNAFYLRFLSMKATAAATNIMDVATVAIMYISVGDEVSGGTGSEGELVGGWVTEGCVVIGGCVVEV